jgi:mannose-6-phosphate isomerase-like protein (cupin superfamily)
MMDAIRAGRENLGDMADYTKLNLREVEDMAAKFGMPPGLESRFARDALGLQNQGLTLFTLAPSYRIPFGHRHGEQEEVYVVVTGSARVKLEDEIVELDTWDAVRIPPEVRRGVEAGPDGAEILAVGAPNVGFGDAEQLPDFWPE